MALPFYARPRRAPLRPREAVLRAASSARPGKLPLRFDPRRGSCSAGGRRPAWRGSPL